MRGGRTSLRVPNLKVRFLFPKAKAPVAIDTVPYRSRRALSRACSSRPISRILSSRVSGTGDHPSTANGCPLPLATNPRVLSRRAASSPPIWSCSEWGLPGQPVTRLPVGSYPTISPLPRLAARRYVSVALSCGSPRLGVTQHSALRSSDFPRQFAIAGSPPRSPGRLEHVYTNTLPAHCQCS